MNTNQKNETRGKSVRRRVAVFIPQSAKDAVKTVMVILSTLKIAWRCKFGNKKGEAGQLHRYILFSYPILVTGNLGDNIQTIATKRAISQIDGQATFITVSRRALSSYKNQPPAICVMQGWFESRTMNFLPGESVIPVWVGTHWQNLTRTGLRLLLRLRPNVFRGQEIGCRDESTLKFCKEHGIPAYFSRCLTLTLPRRPPL